MEGVVVNGFVNENGVTININSAKALNSVVGHEITHVLEGTELYAPLSEIITQHAKSKGEYNSRLEAIIKLYEGRDANIEQELVADLVGDYLFSDPEFIRSLSTEHRNVFQKLYDEVKYLCKVATAGSKELRELEKIKKVFQEAYRAETKNPTADGGVKYSIRLTESDTADYLRSGNRNNKSRQEAFAKGEQIILTSEAEIKEYIDSAINKEQGLNTVAYGKVNSRLSDDVSKNSNGAIEIEDAYLELVPSELQHAFEQHSEAKEDGDIPLTVEDFENIPEYLDNYSELLYAIKYASGRTHICVSKIVDNGRILIIETVSKSRGSVQFKNAIGVTEEKYRNKYLPMYKKGSGVNTRGSQGSNTSLRDTTTSNNSVSNTNKNVKQKDVFGFKVDENVSVNEDLLEELSVYHPEAEVDTRGNVTVYHRTSKENAEKIRQSGIMQAKEDALFFSSKDSGYASDYGDTVVKLKIPSSVLQVNDIFDGEVHFDIPLKYKNGTFNLDVSDYLIETDSSRQNNKNSLSPDIPLAPVRGGIYGKDIALAPVRQDIAQAKSEPSLLEQGLTAIANEVKKASTEPKQATLLEQALTAIANKGKTVIAEQDKTPASAQTPAAIDNEGKTVDQENPDPQPEPVVNQGAPSAESMIDRNDFVSRRASQLYKEIRDLKKGVRASQSLGYLLDHGYEWSSIKTALLNIRDNQSGTGGERSERCRWQIKRGERVAAVDS